MKNKKYFQCSECGHREPRWLGRCPECGNWNSLQEKQQTGLKKKGSLVREQAPVPLDSIEIEEGLRFDSGLSEVNRVLGGGRHPGYTGTGRISIGHPRHALRRLRHERLRRP